MTAHELTQRAIEAWNAKGDASVEDRMEAVIACVRAHDAGNVLVSRPVAVADLVDGDRYLVETKHGMIEGQWQATYEHFSAYYWRDMDFWGDAYTLPERPATPSPATGELDAVLEEGRLYVAWLRDQGTHSEEAGASEKEWCANMNAIAAFIERHIGRTG